jgi:hypothetical protein
MTQFRTTNRRWWQNRHGARFVCEDVFIKGTRTQPQHARWVNDTVEWFAHNPGGLIEAFDGPADIFLQLIEGVREV